MKIVFATIALVLFAVFAGAQASSNTSSSASSKSADSVKTDNVKGGKVAVPPEKARAITIPKISTAITIDGRPDEEVWKTAAVFKDFYQTGPGYNTEPSKPTE